MKAFPVWSLLALFCVLFAGFAAATIEFSGVSFIADGSASTLTVSWTNCTYPAGTPSFQNLLYIATEDVAPIFSGPESTDIVLADVEGVTARVTFQDNVYSISFELDGEANIPQQSFVTFNVDTILPCGQNATYFVDANDASQATVSELEPQSTVSVFSRDCSDIKAVFSDVSLAATGPGAPAADQSLVISWSTLSNDASVSLDKAFVIKTSSADADSIIATVDSDSADATVAVQDGVIVVSLAAGFGAKSLTLAITLNAACGASTEYSLSSGSEFVTIAVASEQSLDAFVSAVSCPATMENVELSFDKEDGDHYLTISWGSYVSGGEGIALPKLVVTKASGISVISSIQGESTVADDVDATATLNGGDITIAFRTENSAAFPASGSVKFKVHRDKYAECEADGVYELVTADNKVLIIEMEDSITASISSYGCVNFLGFKIETKSGAAPFDASKGLIITWTDLEIDDDDRELPAAFKITSPQQTMFETVTKSTYTGADGHTGVADTTIESGNTLIVSLTNATASSGSVSISLDIAEYASCGLSAVFTAASGMDLVVTLIEADGSSSLEAAVYALACPATFAGVTLAVTAGASDAEASSGFSFSWTDFGNDGDRPLTNLFAITANPALFTALGGSGSVPVYDNAQQEIDGLNAVIVFSAESGFVVSLNTSTGSVPNEGSFSFTAVADGSAVCDTEFTYSAVPLDAVASALVGTTTATADSAACDYTYGWVCSEDGALCSELVPTQFGECSNECGEGHKSNSPVCGRYVNEEFVDTTDAASCADAGTKPSMTKWCEDYTCPDAVWMCYATGGNITEAGLCSENENRYGFPTCTKAGCAAGKLVERVAVCVASPDATDDLEGNCPKRLTDEPASSTYQCPNAIDNCAMVFDANSQCYSDNKAVNCSDSTGAYRNGVCVDPENVVVSTALCDDAEIALTQACSNLPSCLHPPTLSWSSVTADSCVTGGSFCQSYRQVTTTCFYTNDAGDKVTVADYTCNSATRPPSYVNCANPEIASCVHGACNNFVPQIINGATYSNILATCTCASGYVGGACNATASVSSVKVAQSGNLYTITWVSSNADGVKADIILTGGVVPITVARNVLLTDSKYVFDADAAQTTPGSYTFTVFVSTTLSAKSSAVTISPQCAVSGYCQQVGSTCNTGTGVCTCLGDFSGRKCQISPCDNNKCSATNTVSCSIDKNKAKCNCDPSFTFKDNLCVQPSGCTQTCKNGGTPSGSIVDNKLVCSGCACPPLYTGSTCDTCKEVCDPQGTASTTGCGLCTCKPGFSGATCSCRHASVSLLFPQSAVPWYFTSTRDTALPLFSTNLIGDLETVMNPSTRLSITVGSSKSITAASNRALFLNIVIFVGPLCDAAASVSFTNFLAQAFTTLATTANMEATYAALATLSTAIKNNPNGLGSTLSSADTSNIGITDAACTENCDDVPAGTGTGTINEYTPSSGGSGLTKDEKIAVGVVVGVGGFLIILIIVLAWKLGWCCFNKGHESKSEGVEMVGTYDI